MGRFILLFTSVILNIIFTINAFWIQLNGISTIGLIERLPILLSPAKFVYYIWFVIFFVLFLWVIKYVKLMRTENTISTVQTFLFIGINILQILSLWFMHNNQLIFSIGVLFLQVIVLFILYLSYPLRLDQLKLRFPIALYFSWSTYLFLLTVCYSYVDMGWQDFGLSRPLWAVIIMTLGAAIALHIRYHYFDHVFPIIFIWCYLGIAFSNGFNELLVTTAALFLICVMIAGIIFIKKNPVQLK